MSRVNRREFLSLASAFPFRAVNGNVLSPNSNQSQNPEDFIDPWLEINLSNISWNINQIKKRVENRPIMAVIKANAYGHGLIAVGKHLEKHGIHSLAVGKTQEALLLRENGVQIPILNFGPFSKTNADQIVKNNITQSVFTSDVDHLARAAQKYNITAKVHIKIDTGLGRVGIPHDQAFSFIQNVASKSQIKIAGVFTALTEDDQFDKIQLERFLQICAKAKKQNIDIGLKHVASSAALFTSPQSFLDLVRPGISIYGQYPSTKEYKAQKIKLKPAMSLKTRISFLKTLKPGESVSYHRMFMAKKETSVATLPIGYSDGFSHQILDKGEVLINGNRWPMIGSITSNHTTVNVTGDSDVKIGDEAVLFGNQEKSAISAEEVAKWAGSSVYKILIGMNPQLPRIYFS
jgi:alanine racemase